MQYIGRVVTSVSKFYTDINPATLSGSIDIVVVKQKNGELAASPFHVRFGKLKLLRPSEKLVEVVVNGEPTQLQMKVGEAGEAFFVVKTDTLVPSEYATSPIPTPSEPAEEPEPLSLDGPSEFLPTANTTSTHASTFLDGTTYVEPSLLHEEPLTRKSEYSERENDPAFYSARGSEKGGNDSLAASIISPKPVIYEEEQLHTPMSALPSHLPYLTANSQDSYSPLPIIQDTHSPIIKDSILDSPEHIVEIGNSIPNMTMTAPVPRTSRSASVSNISARPSKSKNNVEYPKSDNELDQTFKSNLDHHQPLSDTEIEYTLESDQVLEKRKSSTWSWGWGSFPVRTKRSSVSSKGPESASKPMSVNEKVETYLAGLQPTMDPSTALSPSSLAHFDVQISACGLREILAIQNKDEALLFFQSHLLSFEEFCSNPLLLSTNPKIVVKLGDRFFNWTMAGPILLSLWAYKKPLSANAFEKLESVQKESEKTYSYRKAITQWFSSKPASTSDKGKIVQDSPKLKTTEAPGNESLLNDGASDGASDIQSQEGRPMRRYSFYAKSLRLNHDQLQSLNLKKGVNTITFSVSTKLQGKAVCSSKIFFWDWDTKIVISDVDGTITKSDALGHLFTMVGKDWTHSGVANLYSNIYKNGYKILYLTSRAIGQATYTREYLKKVEQGEHQLPEGPIIMSPDRLFQAFHREVIKRRPEEFKISCLRDIRRLFGDAQPFYAGFGNRITDALSYRQVDVPLSRIFTIDPSGKIKMELLHGYESSYIKLNEMVDQIFPPLSVSLDEDYNDWSYWRPQLPDIELGDLSSPPSPDILVTPNLQNSVLSKQSAFKQGQEEQAVFTSALELDQDHDGDDEQDDLDLNEGADYDEEYYDEEEDDEFADIKQVKQYPTYL